MNLDESLNRVLSRYDELQNLVATHANPGSAEHTAMLKEFSDLTPVVEGIEALRSAQNEMGDLAELMADPESDGEMRSLAEQEFHDLKLRLPELEQELRILLLPKDEADARNVILEVRAGTGGDEAALFAADLMRMYQRYAEQQGWRFELIETSENELGGYKEASASITGSGVFARLKFESGAHRVQRVPVTESGGRIHTSAATVAVLAGGRGRRRSHRRQRSARRHLPLAGRRRPARQHHRFGGAHHPPADAAWWCNARTRSRSTRTAPRR